MSPVRQNGILTSQNMPMELGWEDEQCICQFCSIFNCPKIPLWGIIISPSV